MKCRFELLLKLFTVSDYIGLVYRALSELQMLFIYFILIF